MSNIVRKCHLLHVCCAPDLVISYLAGARGDLFFYNPNIHPQQEYEKRLNEVLRLAKLWDLDIISVEYEPSDFFKRLAGSEAGIEAEPEGGKRCEICFRLRLEKCAEVVKKSGYASFSTTLTASPKKNVQLINNFGIEVSEDTGTMYLPNIYRKSILYNDAQKLINQLGIYRQGYCGCAFSISTPY